MRFVQPWVEHDTCSWPHGRMQELAAKPASTKASPCSEALSMSMNLALA